MQCQPGKLLLFHSKISMIVTIPDVFKSVAIPSECHLIGYSPYSYYASALGMRIVYSMIIIPIPDVFKRVCIDINFKNWNYNIIVRMLWERDLLYDTCIAAYNIISTLQLMMFARLITSHA